MTVRARPCATRRAVRARPVQRRAALRGLAPRPVRRTPARDQHPRQRPEGARAVRPAGGAERDAARAAARAPGETSRRPTGPDRRGRALGRGLVGAGARRGDGSARSRSGRKKRRRRSRRRLPSVNAQRPVFEEDAEEAEKSRAAQSRRAQTTRPATPPQRQQQGTPPPLRATTPAPKTAPPPTVARRGRQSRRRPRRRRRHHGRRCALGRHVVSGQKTIRGGASEHEDAFGARASSPRRRKTLRRAGEAGRCAAVRSAACCSCS